MDTCPLFGLSLLVILGIIATVCWAIGSPRRIRSATAMAAILFCVVIGLWMWKFSFITATQLCGVYQANYSNGSEILTLKSDGTYIQSVTISAKPPIGNSGKWHFNGSDIELS